MSGRSTAGKSVSYRDPSVTSVGDDRPCDLELGQFTDTEPQDVASTVATRVTRQAGSNHQGPGAHDYRARGGTP